MYVPDIEKTLKISRLIARRFTGDPGSDGFWLHHSAETLAEYGGTLLPAIWPSLNENDIRAFGDDANLFKAANLLNSERNQQIRADSLELARELNRHGIIPMFFKGAAHLLTNLWPDCGARFLADVDLLVPEADVFAARTCLENMVRYPRQQSFRLRHKHFRPVLSDDWKAPVELHRGLLDEPFAELLSARDIYERASIVGQDGVYYVPSPEDQVLIAGLHGLAGHTDYRFPRLAIRDMLDICFLIDRHGPSLDWDRIFGAMTGSKWPGMALTLERNFRAVTGNQLPWHAEHSFHSRLRDRVWRLPLSSRACLTLAKLTWQLGNLVNQLATPGDSRREMLKKLTSVSVLRSKVVETLSGRAW